MTLTDRVLALGRPQKRAFALIFDAGLCVATVAIAYAMRLDRIVIWDNDQPLAMLASVMLALPLFIASGLYRAIFRYVGWSALTAITKACAIYGLIYSAIFTVFGVTSVPRTVGVLQPLLLLIAVGTSRALARYWLSGIYTALIDRPRAVVYGAGSAGRQLAAAIEHSGEMNIVAFVDDDRALAGSHINGCKIYAPDQLGTLVAERNVTEVLLAVPSAARQRRAAIVDTLKGLPIHIRTLPNLMDIAHGRIEVSDLRELEIDDLLGRDPVPPDPALLARNITGKTVLVTGAGGSIGSELCRQILRAEPAQLLLVDSSEFALYSIDAELQKIAPGRVIPYLASIVDGVRLDQIMRDHKPETLYHAAAYKHVPLVEQNPGSAVRNNVVGTLTTAEAAARHQVADFVLISTDKAVRPTNIMGATKRTAELVLQALAEKSATTRFSMVRFGNVLGSSGSVVPLFRQQIREGGPVTVTHSEITRYFMTIPEAAQLVIQAGAMAEGGEVFLLDMGNPIKIIDLARRMIELSGLSVRDADNPEGDIEIAEIGLRPAEKLYEELLIGENALETGHARIRKANETLLSWPALRPLLDALIGAIEANDADTIRARLKALVPEFTPEAV